MADIRFYDLDFNLLRILPPFADTRGYKAIITQQNFNDCGSLEIVFRDDELKQLVEEYRDNMLIVWNGFEGFMTSDKFTDTEYRITGMHLNGLLHRAVIKATTEKNDTVGNIARTAAEQISWLTVDTSTDITTKVTYGTDKPKKADEFLQNLFTAGKCGYEIKADIKNKKYVLKLINTAQNDLMLSKANLNVYNVETMYIGKEKAFGGWYKNGDDVWSYITTDSTKSGIHILDTVLSAETEAEAQNELKRCKAEYEITADTCNIEYGKDYNIGDIIRVQENGITKRQLVSGIERYRENGYAEQPILTDYEEET